MKVKVWHLIWVYTLCSGLSVSILGINMVYHIFLFSNIVLPNGLITLTSCCVTNNASDVIL